MLEHGTGHATLGTGGRALLVLVRNRARGPPAAIPASTTLRYACRDASISHAGWHTPRETACRWSVSPTTS